MLEIYTTSEAVVNETQMTQNFWTLLLTMMFQKNLNYVFSCTIYNRTSFNTEKRYYVFQKSELHTYWFTPFICSNGNLSRKPHIEKVITKAKKVMFKVKRNSPNIPAYIKLNIKKWRFRLWLTLLVWSWMKNAWECSNQYRRDFSAGLVQI